jgi:hypothetical protein
MRYCNSLLIFAKASSREEPVISTFPSSELEWRIRHSLLVVGERMQKASMSVSLSDPGSIG